MTTRSTSLLISMIAACALGTSPASAAIKTYHFSGVHNDLYATPPATDLIPDYQIGDPFSGTLTYDDGAPGGPGSYPGQPLAISVLFDNTYQLNWTAPGTTDNTALVDWEIDYDLVIFKKSGLPAAAADFGGVFATRLSVDLLYGQGQLPADLASVDPNSPDVVYRTLFVNLTGPSLWTGDPGAETSVFFADSITEFTLVPEPSSLILAACGTLGLTAIGRRRRIRARQVAQMASSLRYKLMTGDR